MKHSERTYIAIDLKSFYASVECRERGLDPLTTNLVVADPSRTEKTICLAVSPSLKAYGIPGRARLFEVVRAVREVNAERQRRNGGRPLTGSACDSGELAEHPEMELDYIAAIPRMALYMEYSNRIYDVYLQYVAPEDIHVYSIDEVFMDVTAYLKAYGGSPHDMAMEMIRSVLRETGITATAGIGTNMYLCKIAMDIVAKHVPADEDGVRIAELDEMSYRKLMWEHQPLTDFWRIGRGYARRLASVGLHTMGDIARCSVGRPTDYYNEELLYKMFGVNAELLIDHAWGWEPCTIADVKAYRPQSSSLSSGQVLHRPYTAEKARLVTWEMTDLLVLDLVRKGLVTDQLVLTVGYDIENLADPARRRSYRGPVTTDYYGRRVPKHAHGTVNLKAPTSSSEEILAAVMKLYDKIVDQTLFVRRMNVTAARVISEKQAAEEAARQAAEPVQMDLFTDYQAREQEQEEEKEERMQERKVQQAILDIKEKFGKNAILKGANLEEGATARDRNKQIGGHKA